MSRENKKKIILISILSVVLIALILVYIFVVLPLIEEEDSTYEPPYVAPGEGLYNNVMVTVYPELDKNKINYLEISNESGKYAFHKYYDSSMEKEEMRFVGYEGLRFNESLYAVLIAYIYLPVSYQSNTEENAPMRDVSEEQMREYGVTEDTCRAYYTVGYEENGETKYHTVYIGHPTFSRETTYYVALKGRNSVYRFHQEGVEDCLFAPMEDFVTPLIYGRYSDATQAMLNIERFKIGLSDPNKAGEISTLFEIVKAGDTMDGTVNMYNMFYVNQGTGATVKTGTNVTRLSAAFTALYTYFSGDKVIAICPTDEELEKYGLSMNKRCYFLSAKLSDKENDEAIFQISDEIDGYYYTLSTLYGEEYPILVRVPKATLSFLGTDGKTIFEWAGNDVSSLFYEYLLRNDDAGEPGLSQMIIRAQSRDEKTGNIIYNVSNRFDITTGSDGKVLATGGDGTRYTTEFSDYYRLLISFPRPLEFNNLTLEEIKEIKEDDGAIVFHMYVRDNNDNISTYTYYRIGNTLDVMIEITEGKIENGVEVWQEPQIVLNTSTLYINILAENFQKLLNGEDITPEDYIN